MHRRTFLLAACSSVLVAGGARAAVPRLTVYKTATCGCCGGWVEHMKAAGFQVRVVEVADVSPYRERLGVPQALASCHTAEVEGYVIEGHVPATDVRRLLRERPNARGLALPAMVPGSPGMTGAPVPYATLLFAANGEPKVFERH